MICDDVEPPTLELKTEMTQGEKDSQQLPVKGGISLLGGGEFGGEEG